MAGLADLQSDAVKARNRQAKLFKGGHVSYVYEACFKCGHQTVGCKGGLCEVCRGA